MDRYLDRRSTRPCLGRGIYVTGLARPVPVFAVAYIRLHDHKEALDRSVVFAVGSKLDDKGRRVPVWRSAGWTAPVISWLLRHLEDKSKPPGTPVYEEFFDTPLVEDDGAMWATQLEPLVPVPPAASDEDNADDSSRPAGNEDDDVTVSAAHTRRVCAARDHVHADEADAPWQCLAARNGVSAAINDAARAPCAAAQRRLDDAWRLHGEHDNANNVDDKVMNEIKAADAALAKFQGASRCSFSTTATTLRLPLNSGLKLGAVQQVGGKSPFLAALDATQPRPDGTDDDLKSATLFLCDPETRETSYKQRIENGTAWVTPLDGACLACARRTADSLPAVLHATANRTPSDARVFRVRATPTQASSRAA